MAVDLCVRFFESCGLAEVFAVSHPTLRKSLNSVLPLLVVALIAANIILLRQNHRLKTELPLPSALAVHREEPLHDIGGVGFDGRFHTVEMPRSAAEHLLVFTFAPRCPECVKSKSSDADLSAQAKKLGWRTVWISRGNPEETRAFCDAGGIPLEETLVNPPYATYLRLGLAAVPQVVAIGENGKVDEVWLGRLTPESAKTAAQFLSDHPGVQASNSPHTSSP
jgi:peroxiredoxin